MKYALLSNIRTEPFKGGIGACPGCGAEVIARCGARRMHHWAHKGQRNCDPWWENETEWHRQWKNKFPAEWQEAVMRDERSGEKHRADILTPYGLAVEFQHSFLNPVERRSRESFYKSLVWVVDGTRRVNDQKRFKKCLEYLRPDGIPGRYKLHQPTNYFPESWLGSPAFVVFDFKGLDNIDAHSDPRNHLFAIHPAGDLSMAHIFRLTRESFVDNIMKGRWFLNSP
jgi:competence protein CoiA